MTGALRHEEIDHRVELELVQRLGGEAGVGQRHHGVEADGDQALDLTGVDRLHDLLSRQALAGDLVDVHAPHRGHVGPVLGVGDIAIAGELVALVSLLPASLAVALSGDR